MVEPILMDLPLLIENILDQRFEDNKRMWIMKHTNTYSHMDPYHLFGNSVSESLTKAAHCCNAGLL